MDNLLRPDDRAQVEALAKNAGSPAIRRRAQLLLLYDEGLPTREVAGRVGLSRGRTRYWRGRYQKKGLAIFSDETRSTEGADLAASVDLSEETTNSPLTPEVAEPQAGNSAPQVGGGLAEGDVQRAGPPVQSSELAATTEAASGDLDEAGGEAITDPGSKRSLAKAARAAEKQARLAERLEILLAIEQPGVRPDDPLSEAGRKVLAFHFAEMLRHEEGTRQGEDIEQLHDMRVATRRMRAAFEVFESGFDPQEIEPYIKGLRETGRALGRVRDLDVFMEKAQRYLDGLLEEQRDGLEPLLDSWRQERATDREVMLAHLDSERYATFKRKFAAFLTTPGRGARRAPADQILPSQARHVAPVLIYARLAAARAFGPLLDSASIEQLHALRIEFKKLRYTVEFFKEVLGKQAKEVINDLKALQDHLGDLNDAEVACQILRDFLDDWETRQLGQLMSARQNPEPIVAYLAAKHAERHRLMVTFPQSWECFDRPEFRQNLALAVSVL